MGQGTPFASLTADKQVVFERQLELNARLESCLASTEAARDRASRVVRARRAVEEARRAVERIHREPPSRSRPAPIRPPA
jgi:hypothetical protein